MKSSVAGGSVGLLAGVVVLLAAGVGVQSRAAPGRHLPIHLMSLAAALRDAEAAIAEESDSPSSNAGVPSSDTGALSSGTGSLFWDTGSPFSDTEAPSKDAGSPSSDAGSLSSGAGSLSSGAGSLSSDAGSLFSGAGLLSSDAEESSRLERPPLRGLAALETSEFADYSGRTSRPRRSKKGRRRGSLRLDRDQYQLWLRSGECPDTTEGEEQFFCPTPDITGTWRCTTAASLCDGKRDCPGGEDEHGTACLFYQAISGQLSKVANHVLKLKAHHRHH